MAEHNETYEVGYGKPPKRTQFVKGKSGNPRGRPRGSKNLATIIDQACREKVTVNRHGRTVRMTKIQASTHQLANRAASGDLKAINSRLSWCQTLNESQQSQPGPGVDENDQATMASVVRRLKEMASIESVASKSQNPDKEKK